jgi:PEP-CTERM motif
VAFEKITNNYMKSKNSNSFYALVLALTATVASASAAVVTYTQGDLLMGFRATGGQGAGTSYVVNIGQASTYRDATSYGSIPIAGNIATDLSATYGSNWASRSDILWGIAGTPSNTATVAGDSVPTLYASKPETSPGVAGSGWVVPGSSTRVSVSTTIVTLQSSFSNSQATANSSAATLMDDTVANTWRQFMASGGAPAYTSGNKDFGAFANIEGTLSQGLTLFRVTDALAGSNEGTFTLSSGGSLAFVPEPTSSLLAGLGVIGLVFRRRRQA